MNGSTRRIPRTQPQDPVVRAARWLGWALVAPKVVLVAVLGWLIVRSATATDPGIDPHGYAMIFSLVYGVPVAIVLIIEVAFLIPSGRRPRPALAALVGTGAIQVLVAGWLTWVFGQASSSPEPIATAVFGSVAVLAAVAALTSIVALVRLGKRA